MIVVERAIIKRLHINQPLRYISSSPSCRLLTSKSANNHLKLMLKFRRFLFQNHLQRETRELGCSYFASCVAVVVVCCACHNELTLPTPVTEVGDSSRHFKLFYVITLIASNYSCCRAYSGRHSTYYHAQINKTMGMVLLLHYSVIGMPYHICIIITDPWSTLVEGDEQPYRPCW